MRLTSAALVVAALLATTAHAAAPQITDPRGDANFTGTGTVTDPASLATFDIVSVQWWADTAQRVTVTVAAHDPAQPGRYVLHATTPTCADVTLTWATPYDSAVLAGCKPRQRRWLAPPVWKGNALTFTLPVLPSWFAAGTTVGGLAADAAPYQDYVVGAAYPLADFAKGTATYVLGG